MSQLRGLIGTLDDISPPEELFLKQNPDGTFCLTWFYNEQMLEELSNPGSPLQHLFFEVRQLSEGSNGHVRSRSHHVDCVIHCMGQEVAEQHFEIQGCVAGKPYAFNVRACLRLEGFPDPLYSPYSATVTLGEVPSLFFIDNATPVQQSFEHVSNPTQSVRDDAQKEQEFERRIEQEVQRRLGEEKLRLQEVLDAEVQNAKQQLAWDAQEAAAQEAELKAQQQAKQAMIAQEQIEQIELEKELLVAENKRLEEELRKQLTEMKMAQSQIAEERRHLEQEEARLRQLEEMQVQRMKEEDELRRSYWEQEKQEYIKQQEHSQEVWRKQMEADAAERSQRFEIEEKQRRQKLVEEQEEWQRQFQLVQEERLVQIKAEEAARLRKVSEEQHEQFVAVQRSVKEQEERLRAELLEAEHQRLRAEEEKQRWLREEEVRLQQAVADLRRREEDLRQREEATARLRAQAEVAPQTIRSPTSGTRSEPAQSNEVLHVDEHETEEEALQRRVEEQVRARIEMEARRRAEIAEARIKAEQESELMRQRQELQQSSSLDVAVPCNIDSLHVGVPRSESLMEDVRRRVDEDIRHRGVDVAQSALLSASVSATDTPTGAPLSSFAENFAKYCTTKATNSSSPPVHMDNTNHNKLVADVVPQQPQLASPLNSKLETPQQPHSNTGELAPHLIQDSRLLSPVQAQTNLQVEKDAMVSSKKTIEYAHSTHESYNGDVKQDFSKMAQSPQTTPGSIRSPLGARTPGSTADQPRSGDMSNSSNGNKSMDKWMNKILAEKALPSVEFAAPPVDQDHLPNGSPALAAIVEPLVGSMSIPLSHHPKQPYVAQQNQQVQHSNTEHLHSMNAMQQQASALAQLQPPQRSAGQPCSYPDSSQLFQQHSNHFNAAKTAADSLGPTVTQLPKRSTAGAFAGEPLRNQQPHIHSHQHQLPQGNQFPQHIKNPKSAQMEQHLQASPYARPSADVTRPLADPSQNGQIPVSDVTRAIESGSAYAKQTLSSPDGSIMLQPGSFSRRSNHDVGEMSLVGGGTIPLGAVQNRLTSYNPQLGQNFTSHSPLPTQNSRPVSPLRAARNGLSLGSHQAPFLSNPQMQQPSSSQALEMSQRMAKANELQQRLVGRERPGQPAFRSSMGDWAREASDPSSSSLADPLGLGLSTLQHLPPPPRTAPSAEAFSSDARNAKRSDPQGRGQQRAAWGPQSPQSSQNILTVLTGNSRWETVSFSARDNLELKGREFLRQFGLKAAFESGLVAKMRSMISQGQAQSSVDIVDLI